MIETGDRRRHIAVILILVVDVGFVLWGAMAAAAPGYLLGPGGKPILRAGVFNVVFGVMAVAVAMTAFRHGEHWAWWTLLVGNAIALVSAMTYDRAANAIGPFEVSEYLGLALVCGALAVTAPSVIRRPVRLGH